MASLQNAVRTLSIAFLILSITIVLDTVQAEESIETLQEIQVYYDSEQPAYLFYDYKLRLLILLNDGKESCWENVNGSLKLVCKPLKDTSIKVVYEEMKEYREARTDDEGFAEVSYKLLTYPTASFKIYVYSIEGYAETKIKIDTKIWMILVLTFFSFMISSLVLIVRRSLW